MDDKILILLLVPGKTDRAFYKALITKVLRGKDIIIADLDSREYELLKYKILDEVFKLIYGSPIKGSSVIKLEAGNKSRTIYVIIWPTEREVVQVARDILENQAGSNEPTIDFVVVADDAEDMGFINKLESLYNSLVAHGSIEVEKEIGRGRCFRLYSLKKPKGIKLMLFVQGIEELDIVDKHAIEDFILYSYMDIIDEIKNRCHYLIDKINQSRYSHKKIALLIVIYNCHTSVEEIFYRNLDREKLEKLISKNDGLQKLIDILVNIVVFR